MEQSALLPSKIVSGSTKVVDFGTNRKHVFDFLLVINSNLCRILHRFGGLKVENHQFVPTPPSFNALAQSDPFKFRDEPDISKN